MIWVLLGVYALTSSEVSDHADEHVQLVLLSLDLLVSTLGNRVTRLHLTLSNLA